MAGTVQRSQRSVDIAPAWAEVSMLLPPLPLYIFIVIFICIDNWTLSPFLHHRSIRWRSFERAHGSDFILLDFPTPFIP